MSVTPVAAATTLNNDRAIKNFVALSQIGPNEWPTTIGEIITKDLRWGFTARMWGPSCDHQVFSATAEKIIAILNNPFEDQGKIRDVFDKALASLDHIANSFAYYKYTDLAGKIREVKKALAEHNTKTVATAVRGGQPHFGNPNVPDVVNESRRAALAENPDCASECDGALPPDLKDHLSKGLRHVVPNPRKAPDVSLAAHLRSQLKDRRTSMHYEAQHKPFVHRTESAYPVQARRRPR